MKYLPLILALTLSLNCLAQNLLEEKWTSLQSGNGLFEHTQEKLRPGSYAALLKPIPAEPGKKLLYQVELRTPRPLTLGVYRLQVAVFDKRGGCIALNTSPQYIRNAADWSKLEYIFRVPADAATMQLRLVHNAVGTVQLRSVKLLTPPKDSFVSLQIPDYAGTLEEKKILHDWSLKCSGTSAPSAWLDYKDKPLDAPYSVCFARDNRFSADECAWVESIVEDPRPAPAPLRRISKVSFAIKTFHAKGEKLHLRIRFSEPHSGWGGMKNHHAAEIRLKPGENWQKMELPASAFIPLSGGWGNADWKNVDGMYFNLEFSGKGELGVKFADITIHYTDGSTGKPFQAWKDPFWYFPKHSGERIQLTMPPRSAVHGSGIYLLDSERGKKHFLALQELLPAFGIQSNVYLRNLLAARLWLKKHGFGAGYQNASPYLWQAAVERDALAVPLDSYNMLNERHHKMDYTSERWNEIWKEVAARFGQYGIPEYQTIDSNFRVVPTQIDRHLNAVLTQTDGGILLNNGRKIHFWDYFKSYTGTTWKPEDLNYKSWSEHKTEPVNLYAFHASKPLQRKKGYLDMAVRHYTFIRFQNGAAKEFAKNKVRYILMNNGDDWRNGNDSVWNVRSLIRGGFVDENYFYHPATCLKAYHLGFQNRAIFAGNDVHHRLIGESGKGGHGPIYWAPEFSYAALFAICAATRYNSFEMDWPSEGLLENIHKSTDYHYDRFRDYYFKSLAYTHATADSPLQPLIPVNKVVSLQESRSMYAGEHRKKLSLAAEKYSMPVSRLYHTLFNEKLLQNCSLLINDCYALPTGMADRMMRFLQNGQHKSILLHGTSAGREIDGTMWSDAFGWNQTTMNAPRQFEKYLGELKFTKGRITASKKGQVIITDAGGAVLSYYPVTKTSGIYFYSYIPGMDQKRDARILKTILNRRGIPQQIKTSGENLYVRSYRNNKSCIYTVFDKKLIDNYKWIYSATENGCYPWLTTSGINSETVHAPKGKFILFSMLSGKTEPVTVSDDRKLVLTLQDVSAEVFHLIPADDKIQLEKLQNEYKKMQKFPMRKKND